MLDFKINITSSAIKRIKHLLSKEKSKDLKLRISVESGGCSGMQYKYEFVTESEADDKVIIQDEVNILIDSISQELLHNCTVDYIENLGNAYFEIRNPQASAKCGCGNSFSI